MSRFLGRARTTRITQRRASQTAMTNGDGSPEGGDTDITSTDYATKSRLLMDLSKDLRELG